MDVIADAPAGRLAEVDTDVHALGCVGVLHGDDGIGDGRPQLGRLVGLERLQVGRLAVRKHQEVAGGIGEGVEDGEHAPAAVHDVRLLVG